MPLTFKDESNMVEAPGTRKEHSNGTVSGESREMTELEKLRAELAALQQPDDAEAEELRRLREDIAFEKAKKKAKPEHRLGRVVLEPGQVIFRQITREQLKRIDAAQDSPPGSPPKTEGQIKESLRVVSEQIGRECMIEPAWEVFQSWLTLYPTAINAYHAALEEHNNAYRRERNSK